MNRGKNIIFISHCILNQNTVVEPLARVEGPYYDIVKAIIDRGIGIHQLPCPEFRELGLSRKPMTKEEYDTEDFRKLCGEISEDTITIMKEYIDSGYNILGLVGINNSPTCSIRNTQGVFMEELMDRLDREEISIDMIDVPRDYTDGKGSKEFIEELNSLIEKRLA